MLSAITEVFTSIGTWIVSSVESMTALFWTAGASGETGSLTLLGVLAVAGLGISVILMIVGIIQNFLHFRG